MYKLMKTFLLIFCWTLFLLSQSSAFAMFMPFNHDIECVSKNDFSSVKIIYNKKENLDMGWQGTIRWEIYTGRNQQLSNLLIAAGIIQNDNGFDKLITREAPAATFSDWIQQDAQDPNIVFSALNGTIFKISERGKPLGQFSNYVQSLRISKVTEKGYTTNHTLQDQTYYLMELSGTGVSSALVKYELSECRVFN